MMRRGFFSIITLLLGVSLAWAAVPRVVAPKFASGGGGSSTTWSTTDHDGHTTLSNGNLTATADATATSAYTSGRATTSIASGEKRFWSVTVVANANGENNAVGVASAGFTLNDWLGDNNDAIGHYGVTGNVYLNYIGTSTAVATLNTAAVGDVVDIAVYGGNNVWFRVNGGNWNDNPSADPATNTGGLSISGLGTVWPAYTLMKDTNSASYTANFGATTFPYAPPSGYSALP